MGNTVIVMIRMLKARESIYNPPSLLFIFFHGVFIYLGDECSEAPSGPGWALLTWGCWRGDEFSTYKRRKSVHLYWICCIVRAHCSVAELLSVIQWSFGSCVHTFESFFANDNYSNTHSNGCACLIETVEINILNMLFFQLMKHLITL